MTVGSEKTPTKWPTAACGSSSGGAARRGAEDRVGEVVGDADALQERQVGELQVARAPAQQPGVERDDERRVAGRLGAARRGWPASSSPRGQ